MLIRNGEKDDISKIVDLRKKLWEYEKSIADFNIKVPNLEEIEKDILKYYEDNNNILVLEVDEEIVGFIYGSIEKASDYINDFEKTGYISSVFIEEKYRGKGYSKKLIEEFLKWFEESNIQFIQLGVLGNNLGAIKLYEKYGFKTYYCKMKRI